MTTEQGRAGQGKALQIRAEQAGQGRARQSRAEQGGRIRVEHRIAERSRPDQTKAKQTKAKQKRSTNKNSPSPRANKNRFKVKPKLTAGVFLAERTAPWGDGGQVPLPELTVLPSLPTQHKKNINI